MLRSFLRWSVPSAALVATTLFSAVDAHAQAKVGVVDVQRAVASTEDGLRAQATLKKLFDSRQQELNKKQGELQRQREELDKQSKSLPKDAFSKRAEEWQKQMMDLQAVFVEYNKELEKKQKELTDPVFEKVMQIVRKLAASENLDLVVDKATVAYVRNELDLTDRAVQMYNGAASGSSGPPAPPAKK